ncbi:MAG: pilus assembly protein TadG-related protein [Hyphomicrobium sp.]
MNASHLSRLRVLAGRFVCDTRGTTAVLFAMLAVPVLGLGLAGLDYARAQGTRSDIQSAADAAATAGARMLGAPHTEIERAVRGYLRTNLPEDRRDLDFMLTFAPEDTALTIKMDTTVPTSILGIVGVSELAVQVETTVEKPTLVIEPPAPHRGVTPDLPLPDDLPAAIPDLVRSIPPDQLREAEAAARDIMRELERSGGSADVEQLLRGLGRLR